MPQPTTRLHLPRPCAESWAAMTPTGSGRHCAACQKTVVDFTHKTDAEILAYLRQAGTGKTCGRFRATQVARPLHPAQPTPRPARWQAWLAGLLVAALATQSCQPTPVDKAQPLALAPAATLHHALLVPDSVVATAAPASLENVVTGQVYDVASRRPVSQATVQLPDTRLTAITDATGHFVLQLPETLAPPTPMVLRLLAAGYPPQLLAVGSAQRPTHGLAIAQLRYPLPQMLLGEVEALPANNN